MGLFGLNIGEGPISAVIPPGGKGLGSGSRNICYQLPVLRWQKKVDFKEHC
jgi:hypothetical protein